MRFKKAGLKSKTMTLPQEQGLCPRSIAGSRRFRFHAQGTDYSWVRLAFCRTHFLLLNTLLRSAPVVSPCALGTHVTGCGYG